MAMLSEAEIETLDDELASFFGDPSLFPDPYPMFKRVRDFEPVHWSTYDLWVVTGYHECEQAYLSPALSRAAAAEVQLRPVARRDMDAADAVHALDVFLSSIVNRDPPDHTRLRRLVARAFTPRTIASWEPRIQRVVDRLIEGALEQRTFDFIADIAHPLPESVIGELMGVPREDLRGIGLTLNHSKIMTPRGETSTVNLPPEELRAATQRHLINQVDYFSALVDERRRNPGDDLISQLIAIRDEGDQLSQDELIGTCILLVGAGQETTANLVGNGMLALLRDRSAFDMVCADTALIPRALEEILRHESPSRGQPRMAVERVVIGDKTIEPGQQVMPILNAANRDPRVFTDPDRFDITRNEDRHITFAAGIHFCLGASLARLEALRLYTAIAERLSDLRLAVPADELRWRPAFVRGLFELPVTLSATATTGHSSV